MSSARTPKQPPKEQHVVRYEDGDEEDLPPAIEPPADAPVRKRAPAPPKEAEIDDEAAAEAEFAAVEAKVAARSNQSSQSKPDPQLTSYNEAAFRNKGGGLVRVDFEAGGRFSIPESLHASYYTLEHITNISLSRPDDTLEVLINTVQKLIQEPGVQIGQALVEEFMELIIGIKRGYSDSDAHTHKWLCQCQMEIAPSKRKLSEAVIDLGSIKMIPIEKADEMFRQEYVKPVFDIMTDEQFDTYLKQRYGNRYEEFAGSTRSLEIESIRIGDVIKLPDDHGNLYEFRFSRIGDLVEAYKLAVKEYGGKLRIAKADTLSNAEGKSREVLEGFEAEKERELERLEMERGQRAILYSKALSLCKMNGRELSVPERLRFFSQMDWKASERFSGFHEAVKFGIHDEREFTCNLCRRTERGLLQQRFNPVEFIPESDSKKPGANGRVQRPTGSLVFFGA